MVTPWLVSIVDLAYLCRGWIDGGVDDNAVAAAIRSEGVVKVAGPETSLFALVHELVAQSGLG